MATLVVVVVLLAIAVLFNLILTYGLVHRVRFIQENAQFAPRSTGNPEPGTVIGPFSCTDQHGVAVTERDLQAGDTIVGFFSSGCSTCAGIVASLSEQPPAEPLLAFVDAGRGPEATARLAGPLRRLGRVVLIDTTSTVVGTFGVTAFPTFVRVHRGVIVKAGGRLQELGLHVPTAGRTRSRG